MKNGQLGKCPQLKVLGTRMWMRQSRPWLRKGFGSATQAGIWEDPVQWAEVGQEFF